MTNQLWLSCQSILFEINQHYGQIQLYYHDPIFLNTDNLQKKSELQNKVLKMYSDTCSTEFYKHQDIGSTARFIFQELMIKTNLKH